jgi:hypothetical protein
MKTMRTHPTKTTINLTALRSNLDPRGSALSNRLVPLAATILALLAAACTKPGGGY